MKNHIIIAILSLITITTYGQSITQLMNGFDNKFALDHTELFTKKTDEDFDNFSGLIIYENLRIVNVDADWLQNITLLIKQNPTIVYPYLDSSTQNLAAYILLAHVFEITIPTEGTAKEQVYINILKKDIYNPQLLTNYVSKNSIPAAIDPSAHMLNSRWGLIAYEANVRIKLLIP